MKDYWPIADLYKSYHRQAARMLNAAAACCHRNTEVWPRTDWHSPQRKRTQLVLRAAAVQVQARRRDVSLPASLSSTVYLSDFCTPVANVAARSQLRSARHHLVIVPRYNRSTYECFIAVFNELFVARCQLWIWRKQAVHWEKSVASVTYTECRFQESTLNV